MLLNPLKNINRKQINHPEKPIVKMPFNGIPTLLKPDFDLFIKKYKR